MKCDDLATTRRSPRVDVFTIWVTVLLAIGLSVTGKIPRQRAAIAAVIMWLVGALPTVLQAARQ